jgi:hypothetical protein
MRHALTKEAKEAVAVRDEENPKERAEFVSSQPFSPLAYSVDAFLPILNLHQEDYWLPNATKNSDAYWCYFQCGRVLRWYLWFHIGIGWIFTTLFVAGLSGLIRKT